MSARIGITRRLKTVGRPVNFVSAKAVGGGLQNQLNDLKTRGQRKRVTLNPDQTFADIHSIKSTYSLGVRDKNESK